MLLFGIEKNKNDIQNSFSSFDIKNIIKLIEKYDYESKIRFNYKNNLIIPKISKNVNQNKIIKKDNNSSATTKQSTFNSSVIQQKMKKFINVNKNDNDIIIGLKKIKNEKKSITSYSLLIAPDLNKNIPNSHIKALTSYNYIKTKENSKSKSIKKDNKKINKIKVNQKLLINDNNVKYLTERSLIKNKFKNIKINLDNNLNNTKNINNNSRLRTSLINKKSIDFNWCSQISIKNNTNTNIYKHKRINTNSNLTGSSKYKSYKIKLLNRAKAKNNFNNKLKLNLKEIRELIKNNKNTDKKCNTEREYIIPAYKYINKDKNNLQQNLNNEQNKTNIYKKINTHKKSIPSIDLKKKINKNLLLSQKVISSSKTNKLNIKTSFLPLPNFKINKNKIIQICNRKISSNIDKIIGKNCYTERASLQNSKKGFLPEKVNYIISNDFSIFKNIEEKYSKTTANSKNKDKLIINNKGKNNINKTFLPFKKAVRGYKKIKRKEISPFEYSKYSLLNNTERNKKIVNMKMILKLNNK